uniref:MAM domain-containing protein n=1 Tax=Takifugu rubripes TaxID=31033 RepID=A0A674PM83_TAKRU
MCVCVFVFLQINSVFVTVILSFLSAGSSFVFVNTSGHYGGQRAQLMLPPLKENDTHCVSFLFYHRRGSTPPVLNIYIKEHGLLGVPVFNASGPAYHIWKGVELAVSTFWPNYYQAPVGLLCLAA